MDSLTLSSRVAHLGPSPTLAVTAKARTMKAQGIDVIGLSAGEPDFPTPEPIRFAAIEAMENGFTKYTTTSGTPELKQAIVEKMARDNGIAATPDQVVVSCGAKHSIYNALNVLLDPGDEAIVLAPFWMTYADQIGLCGAKPVILHTDPGRGFQPDLDEVRATITPRTKVLMINSPTNPTGSVYPRETIEALTDMALSHGMWIISDEIYEKLIYEGEHVSPASYSKEAAERTITVNGCSKSYAMTGWRIGFSVSPVPVAKAMSNLQDQVTSNPTSFAQVGAAKALNLPDADIVAMREEFRARRDLMVRLLNRIPNVNVQAPKGAFYVFPDMSAYLGGKVKNDLELADYLLDVAHVAAVPGSVFHGKGHIRLSCAAGRSEIEKGISRIAEALTSL